MTCKTLYLTVLMSLLLGSTAFAQDFRVLVDPDKPVLAQRYDLSLEALRVRVATEPLDATLLDADSFTAEWAPPAYDD